jgi:GDP/UDP-N,N'-diacetylbacillosamine 2-epimerase (hydrolysing)
MSQSSKKIIFVTTSRAEFGQFSLLLKKISDEKKFDLKLVVSGSHLFKDFGSTIKDINNSNLKIIKTIKIIGFKNVNFNNIPIIFSKVMKNFSLFLKSYKPDFIIIPCDRFEQLIFAITSFFFRIPIIHFYGGEVSKGAIDNTVRNQISLMAKYHFVSNILHKKNLIRIGIEEKNIFNIGAITYDRIKKVKLLTTGEIQQKIKIKFLKPILLVSFHPVTLDRKNEEFDELVGALSELKEYQIIFTGPNNDPGHKYIQSQIKKLCKKNSNKYFHFPHLSEELYFSIIKHSHLIIGNSSGLLYEIPYFKKISINIGTRQEGRMHGNSVINIKAKKSIILKTINHLKYKKKKIINPFYKSNSIVSCVNILKKKLL